MKEVKKVLSAALAATLATGAIGTVAGAAPIDDLYKAAYDATINALEKKDQDSINAAREAINKLPSELQGFKGELSKQVDTVQHPILVTIVDAINNAEKTLKQVDINTARKSIPANLPEVWRNSYSTGVDNAQQKLIKKATDAADKAVTTGKKADLDIAKALLKEISTVENNEGVKTWLATYEKDFTAKIKLTVDSLQVVSNNTIKVNFTREVDATSVAAKAFSIVQKEDKSNVSIASVKLSDDKKTVEVKFSENVTAGKEYTVDVKDLKDLNGNTMVAATETFAYAKADSMTVKINKTKISINEDLKKSTVVTDNLGRNVTDDVTVTFESSNTNVLKDGIGIAKGEVVVTAVVKDDNGNVLLRGDKTIVEVNNSVATEYQGYSVATNDSKLGNTYSNFDKSIQVKKGATDAKLVFFFKDQFGTEMQAISMVEVLDNKNGEIATVDNAGNITTKSEGTAYFKVKIQTEPGKTVEKVVSVNVVGKTAPDKISLDKTSLSFVKGSAIAQEIKLSVKDQYGDLYEGEAGKTQTIRYQVKNNATGKFEYLTSDDVVKYVLPTTTQNVTNGEAKISLAINPAFADKFGDNTFKVIYELNDGNKVVKTLEQEFTTSVKDGSTLARYEVGTVTALDLLDDVNTKTVNETEGTFTVDSISKEGAVIDHVKTAKVEILDKTGKVVGRTGAAQAGDVFNAVTVDANGTYKIAVKGTNPDDRIAAGDTPTGDYTVKVYVGNSKEKEYTLTVKDSAKTAEVVTFTKKQIDTTTGTAITALELKSLVDVKDQFGNRFESAKLDSVLAVNPQQINVTKDASGNVVSYDLVINKVNVKFVDTPGVDDNADAMNLEIPSVTIHVVVK